MLWIGDHLMIIAEMKTIHGLSTILSSVAGWLLQTCGLGMHRLMGYQDPRRLLKQSRTRDDCVVRCGIGKRWKSRPTKASSPDDFLFSRCEPCSLDVLLQKDVSLYCITSDVAVFVRTPSNINCYSSETSPFFYMAQFMNAEEVYVVSRSWFSCLSLEIEEEKDAVHTPVTWLSSTGRCGSTMLTQIMEGVPGTVCISEPDALLNIVTLIKSDDLFRNERLLENAITVLLYHAAKHTNPPPAHIFMKTRSECAGLVEDMPKIQRQDIRHVFMFRRLLPLFKSMKRVLSEVGIPWMALVNCPTVAFVTPYFRRRAFDQEFYGKEHERELLQDLVPFLSYLGILATTICSHLRSVRRLQRTSDIRIPALLYEDVVKRPLVTVGSLFDYLKLPQAHLDGALQSMLERSQRKVPALDGNGQSSKVKLTESEREELSDVLNIFWLPDLDTDIQFKEWIGHGQLKFSS
ncbi:hypothetical protein ACOMHN_042239 [Nucella lapillus]